MFELSYFDQTSTSPKWEAFWQNHSANGEGYGVVSTFYPENRTVQAAQPAAVEQHRGRPSVTLQCLHRPRQFIRTTHY